MWRFALVSVGLVALFAVLIVSNLPGHDPEARAATKDISDAVTMINSDVAFNLKLIQFEKIRRYGTSEAVSELVKLTGSTDAKVSAIACTTLARMKTDESKSKLKDIIKDTKKAAKLRTEAMNALARGGTSADRSWIDSKASSDPALKSHLSNLKSLKFWK